jgi:hypothetical protein
MAEKASLEAPQLQLPHWCAAKYPTIWFENVRLTEEVQCDLRDHYSTTKNIYLTGCYTNAEAKTFSGQATVTLLRAPNCKM